MRTNLSPALKMMSSGGATEDRAIADMREGQLSGASFAVVADVQVLNVVAGWRAGRGAGLHARRGAGEL